MISFFARHPTAANLLMLILLASGLFSMWGLRRETFPDFRPTEVEIRIVYRGATAAEVEEAVCQRVEDALDEVKFVAELRSDAREGMAIITVEMEAEGVYQVFKDEIDTAVAAIDDFPPQAEDPIITQLHTTDLVLSLLVTGPMPLSDLKAYCEDLKERLQQQPDVSLVKINGFSDHQFRVELSDEALRRYRLNAAEVAKIVSRQSINLPVGAIEVREGEIAIRLVEERRSPRELEDLIVVAGRGGAEIRLKDIAAVTDLFELEEERVMLGDRRAGLLKVEIPKNRDVIRVANAVKAFVERERQSHPQLNLIITEDSSTLISDRLDLLAENAWQGMVLVFVTMWLFFNRKLSFWVVMSLPVSILGALFSMQYLGLTVNLMTMVGLLLALGLLVDDAIVIAENVATHRARGKPGLQAALDGVHEVRGGVLSSFITTVCVLGPLAMVEGDIGKVVEVLPQMLIIVLVVSLVEAFFILPAHLGHALHDFDPASMGGFRRRFDGVLDWFRERIVGRTVDTLLRWRYLWSGAVICLFLTCLGLVVGGVVKFHAFPEIDGDVVEARLLLPPGTPLERTREVVTRVTEGLARVSERMTPLQPAQQQLVETVYVRFNQNPDAFDNGPHVATVTADLLTAEKRHGRLDDVFQAWREEVGRPADVISLAFTEPGIGPAGRNLEIRLRGSDLATLKAAATQLQQWLSGFVGASNLADDLHVGKPEVHLRLREGAFGLGLDARNMADQLRAAFQGVTADEIQVGVESYEIDVQLRHDDRNSLADFEYFFFTLPDGSRVPLDAVAEIDTRRGWSRIARVNGMRTVTVIGDVDSRLANTGDLIAQLRREFLPKLSSMDPQIEVSVEGEPKEGGLTRRSLRRGLLLGLLGVFVLLSFQFRSCVEPLIVMAAIPLALTGVILGHLFMGIDLCMPSIVGFFSLAGIVVNDSILLVLFLKMRRQEGAGVLQAAAEATRQRFRAIIITSLTTVAALLPLLTEKSLQAQVLVPLATSVAFGLMASTVLVLLVIPSLYAILDDLGLVSIVEPRQGPESLLKGKAMSDP